MKRVFTTIVVITAIFVSCKKDKPKTAPSVTTSALTSITTSSATAGGTITSDGNAGISAAGIVWSKTNNTPSLTDSIKTSSATSGSFTVNLTGLDFNTTYYLRAYATNSIGTSYGSVVTLNTANDTSKVRFTYMGQQVTYGVITSPVTGKKWMDRNLGASGAANSTTDTASFGYLFQWGRLADGHQVRISDTTSVLATSDVPGHNKFIGGSTTAVAPNDWRTPQNDNLWQGSTGANNPCPAGWHVPTKAEWTAENLIDKPTAFNNLKLIIVGYRHPLAPTTLQTSSSYYWSSTVSGTNAWAVSVGSGVNISGSARSVAGSIRCIHD